MEFVVQIYIIFLKNKKYNFIKEQIEVHLDVNQITLPDNKKYNILSIWETIEPKAALPLR